MIKENLSKELQSLLQYIQNNVVREYPTLSINSEYLVLGMLEKGDCLAYNVLNEVIPLETISKIHQGFIDSISRKALHVMRPNMSQRYSPSLEKLFARAYDVELPALGGELLNSLHILLALINPETEEKIIAKVFDSADLKYEALLEKAKAIMSEELPDDDLDTEEEMEEPLGGMPPGVQIRVISGITPTAINNGMLPQILAEQLGLGGMRQKQEGILPTLCTNLNEEVIKGNIDIPIGRISEYNKLINVLGRRRKNNAIIVGADGVGKTALCEGLAYKIVHGDVPSFLAEKTIWSLNLASLVAGSQYRGMLEDRMQKLVNELKKGNQNILYIDDISIAFADKKNADVDFASVINSMLVGNSVQIIGSCGFKGYRTTFDNNPSLARKFQKINIEETNIEDTKKILLGIKENYEKYHNVLYTDEALDACVSMAQKYIPERHLPDSAIDIFDESGARESIKSGDTDRSKELRKSLLEKKQEINNLKKKDKYDEINGIEEEVKTMQSQLKEETKQIKENRKNNPVLITKDMVYDVVAEKTGIPIARLSADEKKNILSMDTILKQSIIGQDNAIEKICRAIKRNRVGLGGKKTMGAFMMIGKTGVGKTLLAKQLAKEVFGDEKYLVRIDMSEYEDKTSVNKLIGSSAGYVGYENGGVLTETIKNKKYCVLLLDEFEKADPEIYNLFLQVFDEGYLNDNTGQRIDFKNIIVLLTSNVGAKAASDFGRGIGFDNVEDKSNKILEQELKKKFSPEFLNRLDDIIYFNKLTDNNLKEIIKLELDKLKKRLNEISNDLEYDNSVVEYIFNQIEEKDYGARPIIRIIQDKIENPITDLMLENDYQNHSFIITCSADNTICVDSPR